MKYSARCRDVSNIKHALIIAHYHREGKIRTDTVDAIKLFCGVFDRVILVSTNLRDAEKAKVHQDCEVIVRENVGYDFYSYREGLLKILKEEGQVRVSLLNSSFVILFPQRLLQNYFQPISVDLPTPFFGLTKSEEIFPHLQSYLLTFDPAVWSVPPFLDWWETMTPISERNEVVSKYEIGLSIFMHAQNVEFQPAFNFIRMGLSSNPSHGGGAQLLELFGLVKVDLYSKNPQNVDLNFLKPIVDSDKFSVLKEGLEN